MLTDAALKHLKAKEKPYKVTDRDGMYIHVSPGGTLSFRLDYRVNGRRETVNFGRYGRDGISLVRAREMCLDAKRAVREGQSPAIEKQRAKRRLKEAKGFGALAERWIDTAPMADSTGAMRRAILERDVLSVWRNRLLTEITPDDLRKHCAKIVDRGAPATAIHVRDIVKQIYGFATLHGEKVDNPDGKKAVDRYLLVEGQLRPYNAPKSSLADFIILGKSHFSIEWKLKNLATRENFDGLKYSGTLRPLYAQDLQNQVLENLGRVGLAVAPVIRMNGHFRLFIRKDDGKLHLVDLGDAAMRACEVYPSRGGSDATRISLHRSVAENVLAKLTVVDQTELSVDDGKLLKALLKRGAQEAVRTALCRGAELERDLGGKFLVSDKLSDTKNWCGLQIEMGAEN